MDWQFFKGLVVGVFWNTNNFIQSLPAWIGIGSFVILCFFPKLGGSKMNLSKVAEHSGVILMVFILISVILTSYSLYKNKRPTFATPDELTQMVLRDRDIKLSDLTREDFRIRNKTFDNCHIYGPAIIHIKGTTMIINSTFAEVLPDSAFIETSNKYVSGAISLEDCIVSNCIFHKISFIGDTKLKEKFKAGFAK